MIHVDEESAILIKQLGNGPQCASPVFRRNMTENVPQAGDDVETLARGFGWKAFRAEWPDLDVWRFIRCLVPSLRDSACNAAHPGLTAWANQCRSSGASLHISNFHC